MYRHVEPSLGWRCCSRKARRLHAFHHHPFIVQGLPRPRPRPRPFYRTLQPRLSRLQVLCLFLFALMTLLRPFSTRQRSRIHVIGSILPAKCSLLHARPLSWHLAPSTCRTHTITGTLQQTTSPWGMIGPMFLSARNRHSSFGGVEPGEFFFFGANGEATDAECRKERGMMWVGRVQTTTYT